MDSGKSIENTKLLRKMKDNFKIHLCHPLSKTLVQAIQKYKNIMHCI